MSCVGFRNTLQYNDKTKITIQPRPSLRICKLLVIFFQRNFFRDLNHATNATARCNRFGNLLFRTSLDIVIVYLGNTGYIVSVLTKAYTGIVKALNRHFPRENLARLSVATLSLLNAVYLQHRLLPTLQPLATFVLHYAKYELRYRLLVNL